MGFMEEKGGVLRILYLGTRNSLEKLEDAAFTKINTSGNAQLLANTTVVGIKKVGLLAGSVVEMKGNGVIGAGLEASTKAMGVLVNDVAGNAYESSSAAASEKGVFVCNMGSYEANIYETADKNGGDITGSYQPGVALYCSQNGLLTTAAGLTNGTAAGTLIGIIAKAPSSNDPFLRFQLRI